MQTLQYYHQIFRCNHKSEDKLDKTFSEQYVFVDSASDLRNLLWIVTKQMMFTL